MIISILNKLLKKFNKELILENRNIFFYDNLFENKFFKKKKLIIFDIGSNIGQSIPKYQKLFRNYEIHCFEPNTDAFKILKKNYGSTKNIILNNLGLGAKNEIRFFYPTRSSAQSSFYKVNKKTDWLSQKVKKLKITKKKFFLPKIKTQILTLDSYCKKKNIQTIDLVKIDTQAYETQVLKGCKKFIKKNKIAAILTEVIADNTYQKYTEFRDIENLLHPNYRLIGFKPKKQTIYSANSFGVNVMYFNKKKFSLN